MVPFRNLYIYTFNNPITLKDDSGNMPVDTDGYKCYGCMKPKQKTKTYTQPKIMSLFYTTKEQHYQRNINQQEVINKLAFDDVVNGGSFKKSPDKQNIYHKHSSPDNAKYLSPDGKIEIIVNIKKNV